MIVHEFKDVLIALEKIARETGELEDDAINELEKEKRIIITSEEIPSLRSNFIWIWVEIPFTVHRYDRVKNSLKFQMTSNLIKRYGLKIQIDGKSYIKYPESVQIWQVHDNIIDDLKNEHGINNDDFTEEEWEKIKESKQWKEAEIQVAREIVARIMKE